MSSKKWDATITTRYSLPEKSIYEQVIDLVKKENIAKSRAQLLLVKRGLQHTHNPESLVKEKVVYRDRPVEKVVYRDKPEGKHLGMTEHIGGSDTGQRASGDILTSQDKADPPSDTALEEEKSPNSLAWVGWLGGVAGILGLIWWFTRR